MMDVPDLPESSPDRPTMPSRDAAQASRRRQPAAVREMGLRCALALMILAVLAGLDFFVLWSQAGLLESNALVVNISGRQRLRMSRMGLLLFQLFVSEDPKERD